MLNMDVPVLINKLVLEYDHLIIAGPVFPHEVVGFSGGHKYLFPGIAAPQIINFTHWLGALVTGEKYYFRPGNLGYPVFQTDIAKFGVYICYDRHFPEGARALGLNGAEIVLIPSATSRGLSEYLWRIEQPSHAVANGYYVGTINRVGIEPLGEDDFYGQSYFCDPRGQYVGAVGSAHDEELIVRDLDLDLIQTGAPDVAVLPRPPAGRLRGSGHAVGSAADLTRA